MRQHSKFRIKKQKHTAKQMPCRGVPFYYTTRNKSIMQLEIKVNFKANLNICADALAVSLALSNKTFDIVKLQ